MIDAFLLERVELLFGCFDRPSSILELGSCDGLMTTLLAEPDFVECVVAVEGRQASIDRAPKLDKVRYVCANLEVFDLSTLGQFDVVCCAGVLYHLPKPWELLERIAKVTNALFLDTHYAAEVVESREGYDGAPWPEGDMRHPWAGLSPQSFWLTEGCLLDTLEKVGFKPGTVNRPDVFDRIMIAATK